MATECGGRTNGLQTKESPIRLSFESSFSFLPNEQTTVMSGEDFFTLWNFFKYAFHSRMELNLISNTVTASLGKCEQVSNRIKNTALLPYIHTLGYQAEFSRFFRVRFLMWQVLLRYFEIKTVCLIM